MESGCAKYQPENKRDSDHNGVKGYTGVYILKAAIEKAGKVEEQESVQKVPPMANHEHKHAQ